MKSPNKINISRDESTCTIKGKIFPCAAIKNDKDIKLAIGQGPLHDACKIKIEDFDNLSTVELSAGISILFESQSFKHKHLFTHFINLEMTNDKTSIYIGSYIIIKDWYNMPVSIEDFFSIMNKVAFDNITTMGNLSIDKIKAPLGDTNDLIDHHFIYTGDIIISELIHKCIDFVNNAYDGAVERLPFETKPNTILAEFEFPGQVRVACEQYLVYFADFLKDLGIENSTDIKKIGDKFLFEISPKDKIEALQNIKQALSIFLQLPGMPDNILNSIESVDTDKQLMVEKLLANIRHLQSQLHLSHAIRRVQEANIDALSNQSVLQTSLIRVVIEDKKEDSRSFFGDTLRIKPWSKGPFEFNSPKILDGIKEIIRKGADNCLIIESSKE